MKLIDKDAAYGVLDRLFERIQRNNYQVTQEMIDRAWKEWCDLPAFYDTDKAAEELDAHERVLPFW